MHRLTRFLALILGTGLLWSDGAAQETGPFPENHYRVYKSLAGGGSVTGPIILEDQFGESQHTFAVLEKFANPVDKSFGTGPPSGIYDPLFHQTWWAIDDPQVSRTVVVENQFGSETWVTGDGRYLVLPATKNQSPPGPPPQDRINHYKCYDATGPTRTDIAVGLVDQFLITPETVREPRYICNPVKKQIDGQVTDIVDPDTHLACYSISTDNVLTTILVADQFGLWGLIDLTSELLCLPSTKKIPTPTEESSWGELKSIYR